MIMKLKNISGQIKQLYTHEFQVDESIEVDTSWYESSVITSISNNEMRVLVNDIEITDVSKQLDYLRGSISVVDLQVPKDSNQRPIFTGSPFSDASGFRFRGASFKGTISANSTENIDFLIAQERWINGGIAIIDNIGLDDQITFQVVDKDNILGYGAGVVLDEFISGYYIPQDGKLEVALAYPARIMAGLYLRLRYTSTHNSGCTLKCNLYLHWKAQ